MSRSKLTRFAAAVVAGAGLMWGGSNLHGQQAAPEGAAVASAPSGVGTASGALAASGAVSSPGLSVSAASVGAAPAVGGGADLGPLALGALGAAALSPAPFAPSAGVIVPTASGLGPDVAGDGVAAIPLPPSAYPGMVGLATAAYAGWRYRRRRR